jgi:hypothetical protein
MRLQAFGNGIKIYFILHGPLNIGRVEREKLILAHRIKQLEAGKVQAIPRYEEDED